MPYASLFRREEKRPPAAKGAATPTDRTQLAEAIAACQHQLTDLLERLGAPASNPQGAPAAPPSDAARAVVTTTLRRLEDMATHERGVQFTEFEERVWRRLVEAMRAELKSVEAVAREDAAALRTEIEGIRHASTEVDAAWRAALAAGLADLEDRLAQRLAEVVATPHAGDGEVRDEIAALRAAAEADRHARDEIVGDLRMALAGEQASRRSTWDALADRVERLATAYETTEQEMATRFAALEPRVGQLVDAGTARLELTLQGEIVALRREIDVARRAHAENAAAVHDVAKRLDDGRAAEREFLGDAVARIDAERVRAQVEASEQIAGQLATFETRLSQRLHETSRADARRLETSTREIVDALRGEIATVRREHAAATADLRALVGQRDGVRAGELAALKTTVERLAADLTRSSAAVEDRILHHVRRARIAVDEEMVALRRWAEAAVARSEYASWPTLSRVWRDPFGLLADAWNLLPRW